MTANCLPVSPRIVWLLNVDCNNAIEAEIREGLVTAGIAIESQLTGPYGVLCFETIDDRVLELLHEARRSRANRVVAVCSRAIQNNWIWRLLHAGASDVVVCRQDADAPAQIAAKLNRYFEVDEIAARIVAEESLIGESPAWRATIRKVVEAARFSTLPMLLTGESGTGKELLAKVISVVSASPDNSQQLRRELVTVDCGSLVPELSGSEFFGHERGAFTGAHAQREGAFALADGATLLLDEIGEVPLALQVQLLRTIQEKTYKRVGGNVWQRTNFRLVCATNRDLEELVRRGQFRLDLYYRIAGCVFRTPSLAQRKEDILPLARHFLRDYFPMRTPQFDEAVSEYLVNRDYEGNVRELRQLVQRIAHRHAEPGMVTAGDIPEDDRPRGDKLDRAWPDEDLERSLSRAVATGVSLKQIAQAATDAAIRIAVRSEGDNLQRAAIRLGVTDRALQLRKAAGQLKS